MTTYGDDGPLGVSFAIETATGSRGFALPVAADRALGVMQRDGTPRPLRTIQQAQRVSWRIAKDWLEAQLALIATEMVTFEQVMLPYMQTPDGRTMYELYMDDQLPALMPRRGDA